MIGKQIPQETHVRAPKGRVVRLMALVCAAGISLCANATGQPSLPDRGSEPNAGTQIPLSQSPLLKRGLNLSRWWEAEHDRALDDSDIRNIKAMGFDFVRLPLDPRALDSEDGRERMQTDKLTALRYDLETLIDAGFSVVLDLHPKNDFQRRLTNLAPEESRRILENFWRGMSETLKGLPPERLLIQFLNEPKLETNIWWGIQEKVIESLRPVYPHNTFVATASPDSGWWQLEGLKPYKDSNVVYDFHFYEPMTFTHHQLPWDADYDPKRAALPVPYPVDPSDSAAQKTDDPTIRAYLQQNWNREKLSKLVGKIAKWQKENNTRLVCLEFGVYSEHVDEWSRLNWLRDVREELGRNGIPSAMWEFKGPFGLLPTKARHGDAPTSAMIEALQLDNPESPNRKSQERQPHPPAP